MQLTIHQVDAFTNELKGNYAAVIVFIVSVMSTFMKGLIYWILAAHVKAFSLLDCYKRGQIADRV